MRKPVSLLELSAQVRLICVRRDGGGDEIRSGAVGAVGVPDIVAVSSASKLMSLLVGLSWWISTAITFAPLTSSAGLMR